MRKQKIQSLIILLCWLSSFTFIQAQVDYFPPAGQWKKKQASAVGLNAKVLERAISFALRNEYSGSRDLRQAILKGFSREPFHSLLGPTKKRGGPAGIIIKDGYWMDTKTPPEPDLFVMNELEAFDIDYQWQFDTAEVLYKNKVA